MIEDEVLEEFEIFLRKALVSQMGVFSQDIGGKVIMLIFAVKQDQVGEGFSWERRVLQQEVKLFEASGRILFDIHQSGVMEGHGIEFILISGRHIHKSLSGCSWVFHGVLDSSLKIESLNKSGLFECLRVTYTLDLNTFRI